MGHKVLLADDSITVQKIVKLSLTEEGIEVIALGNGEQAVQQLETLRPDLVMADVFMPGKDGYEVCEFVKSHPQLKNIPVILLVHAFEPFDPDRAKKVGADHQLTKPFQSIRTLVTTVRDLLQTPTVAESPASSLESFMAPPTPPLETASVPLPTPMKMPEDEFAAVSSLSAAVNLSSNAFPEAGSFTSVTTTPDSLSFSPPTPIPMPEANFPVPLTSSDAMLNADLFPPSELSVLGTAEWQPSFSAPTQTTGVPTESSLLDNSPAFASSSATINERVNDPFNDDVLELSDVIAPDLSIPSTIPNIVSTQTSTSDIPLLTVLGPPTTRSEVPVNPAESVVMSQPSSFGGPFDIAAGQMSVLAEVTNSSSPLPVQDVSSGTVDNSNGIAAMSAQQIPEAVIEEIVNRVIQRLSTNAIQEIAWEVVPEMAELLIRKQIAQQPQIAH